MGDHDAYGKAVLRRVAGQAFIGWGPSVEVDYGAGRPARVDGTVSGTIVVEIESRTSKQVRGAVLDLVSHPYPKKLLVLLPMHMSDCETCAEQCRRILSRYVQAGSFRVVVLDGTGIRPSPDTDARLIWTALHELGF